MKNVNCYYCINSKIVEENGIKKTVCASEHLDQKIKDELTCTYSCRNFIPTEEQKVYDEYQRTHSIHYEEPKSRKRA